ncbi:MAG: restriction endonuclease subunit S [Chromatiales bacterium]|nr:restriction endonuclease subunit S [Chromatiales bacterium]
MIGPDTKAWTTGTLGELLPIKYGKSLPEKMRDASGTIPVFGSSGRVGVHAQPLTKGPALIVGRKGTVGAVYFSAEPCWPIDTVYFAEADQGQNLRYFKYLLDSLNLVRLDRSTAVPGLSRDDYNALNVKIAPAEEQYRIVAEIDKQFSRLDEAVANLKRAKVSISRYRTSVLADAAGSNEDSWPTCTIGSLLCEPIVNGLSIKESQTPTAVRALRLSAMSDAGLDYADYRFLPLQPTAVEDIVVREGEFFVSRGNGSLALVGRGSTAQTPPGPVIFPDTMMRLRFADASVRRWVAMLWPSRLVRSQIEHRVKTTAGIYKIAQPQVASISVPLPPATERDRILAEVDRRLSIVHEVETEVDSNLRAAKSLRQAVLRRAFSDGVEG